MKRAIFFTKIGCEAEACRSFGKPCLIDRLGNVGRSAKYPIDRFVTDIGDSDLFFLTVLAVLKFLGNEIGNLRHL